MNATWHSTTPTVKPVSNDRQYYFLPYWDEKPTMWIRATFPDHRRRLYNSNVIGKPADKLVCSLLYCFALILYYWTFTPKPSRFALHHSMSYSKPSVCSKHFHSSDKHSSKYGIIGTILQVLLSKIRTH